MKFTTTAQNLKNALSRFRGIIQRRNTIPILSCVLIDGGTLRGTDLNTEISVDVPSRNEGAAAVDYFHLSQVVSTLSPDAEVTIEGEAGGEIALRFPGGCYWLFTMKAEDFPRIEPPKKPVVFRSGNAGLAAAFRRVHHAICTEATRYYLNGVCLGVGKDDVPCVVSTDGHRLAFARLPGASGFAGQIVPRPVVEQVMRAEEPEQVRFSTDDRPIIEFRWPGVKMIAKLIDGKFPDWNRVIPEHGEVRLCLDVAETRAALRRMDFGYSRSHEVAISLFGKVPTLTRKNDGRGAVEILASSSVSGAGTSERIGFNANYLKAMLAAQGGEQVEICISDDSSPVICETEALTTVLMPLRSSLEPHEVRSLLNKSSIDSMKEAA